MKAIDLIKRYSMEKHAENGSFVERHYENTGDERADSGSIYYYVAPGERTMFHRIDCDEYWIHVEGSNLLICSIDEDGNVKESILGKGEDGEPLVYFKAGEIFASRNLEKDGDGAFVVCITVPRFTYDGFEMFTDEELLEKYPEIEQFMK